MNEYTMIIVLVIAVVGIVKIIISANEKRQRENYRNRARSSTHMTTTSVSHTLENNNSARHSQNLMNVNQHDSVGPVIYYGNTNHNARDVEFRFKYVFKNGSWRAYILRHPSFNGRDEALTVTHRYRDHENNMYYVCWDSPVVQLKDMQNVSKFWADSILEYIATGKKFGPEAN